LDKLIHNQLLLYPLHNMIKILQQ